MTYRRLGLSVSVVAAMVAALAATPAGAGSIPVIDDSQLQALTATVGGTGGAPVLNTNTTVPHWFGQTTNPLDGVTYGYNMVGADPNSCSGSACDVTIQADIVPLIVTVHSPAGSMTFDGRNVVAATLASPLFATNDYGSTSAATAAGAFPNAPLRIKGPGGVLSQNDAGNQLQLEDATMRAQFNKYGSYHVRLQPHVLAAESIDVPSDQGTVIITGRGTIGADVDVKWWANRIQNLMVQSDPTHLPIYTTDQVLLHIGPNILNCCVIGFHGAGLVPGSSKAVNGSGHGNGNQPVQTFAWATYLAPGFYARPNGGTNWAIQDIHPLSHEISEWADDPFVNNVVQPWLTPTAPQYGCTGLMETGDPVVGIGFAKGTNTFQQVPNPNGSKSYDGAFHPEDEVYLPWFMRTASPTSEPTQSGGAGRYTLMGDLNPFPGFRKAATGC